MRRALRPTPMACQSWLVPWHQCHWHWWCNRDAAFAAPASSTPQAAGTCANYAHAYEYDGVLCCAGGSLSEMACKPHQGSRTVWQSARCCGNVTMRRRYQHTVLAARCSCVLCCAAAHTACRQCCTVEEHRQERDVQRLYSRADNQAWCHHCQHPYRSCQCCQQPCYLLHQALRAAGCVQQMVSVAALQRLEQQ